MRKRSKHSLSHYRMVTGNMGTLMPIACVPVIPGDTIQHHTSALIRVSPLNTPVMHPVKVRIHHFFVPNRLVWPKEENGGWEDFITGGPDGNNAQTVPTLESSANGNGLVPYLGGPLGNTVNALPVRAYNLIYNEYYRDQDLVTARSSEDQSLARIAWEKDYFTTARPWTQKGPDVTIPIGGNVPVVGDGTQVDFVRTDTGASIGHLLNKAVSGDNQGAAFSAGAAAGQAGFDPDGSTGLHADLSQATAINVNAFREAFAIQRYQEARARYGSRFTEYLRYLGIRPSDARLQRPEYLGGGVSRLNFSEVLQTTPAAEADTNGVGDLYGHGIAGTRTPRYRKFFEEHGYVITLLSVRPKAIYTFPTPREWLKKTKEDYFQKELVHLGQQEVYLKELNGGISPDGVFGYQDRYDEYRMQFSQVGQDFLDTLNSWHLGRFLPLDVALNQSFVECDPDTRIYQVETGDKLWIMANHHIVARRLVPKRARPRIL